MHHELRSTTAFRRTTYALALTPPTLGTRKFEWAKSEVQTMSDNTEIVVGFDFEIVGLESAFSKGSKEHVTILHSSVSPPRRKLAAAQWLLRKLKEEIWSEAPALMYLECLVTTLRSATFALQKMGSGVDGFNAWYEAKREHMRADSQLRWLVEVRNAAEKEGFVLAEYGPRAVVRFHRNGTRSAEAVEPLLKIEGIESTDLLQDLESATNELSAIVEEAHHAFFEGYGPKQLGYSMMGLQERPDGSWGHCNIKNMDAIVLRVPDGA
jgi:hypothetical protein